MSDQMNLLDILNATSSQELEAGQSRFALRGGRMITQCGQVAAHANLFPRQAMGLGLMTHVTSGQRGSGSSSSVVLTQSLGSRLQTQLPKAGWMTSRMIWRTKVTPSGRQLFQLAVSAHRIKEIDCGLWPTARSNAAMAATITPESAWKENREMNLETVVGRSLWPTPQTNAQSGGITATPDAVYRIQNNIKNRKTGQPMQLKLTDYAVAVALWATPKASEAEKDCRTPEGALKEVMRGKSPSLSSQIISTWPTPASRDWKDTGDMSQSMVRKDGKSRMDTLGRLTFNGLTAQTEKRGQLNPAFVCWLMGYPQNYEKLLYTAMETQSCRK